MPVTPRRAAGIGLQAAGVMLMVLGIAHLAATPEIPHLLDDLTPKARAFALGPMLLNHVLVGVLLLPLGFTTWLAARREHLGAPWARATLVVNALATAALPIAVVTFMRSAQYLHAPLFRAGVALSITAALLFAVLIVVATSRDHVSRRAASR